MGGVIALAIFLTQLTIGVVFLRSMAMFKEAGRKRKFYVPTWYGWIVIGLNGICIALAVWQFYETKNEKVAADLDASRKQQEIVDKLQDSAKALEAARKQAENDAKDAKKRFDDLNNSVATRGGVQKLIEGSQAFEERVGNLEKGIEEVSVAIQKGSGLGEVNAKLNELLKRPPTPPATTPTVPVPQGLVGKLLFPTSLAPDYVVPGGLPQGSEPSVLYLIKDNTTAYRITLGAECFWVDKGGKDGRRLFEVYGKVGRVVNNKSVNVDGMLATEAKKGVYFYKKRSMKFNGNLKEQFFLEDPTEEVVVDEP